MKDKISKIASNAAIAALVVAFAATMTFVAYPQEQKVLWRQIKIGSYSVVWPASQGASSTVLTNDGSGNLSWATGGSGGGFWSRTEGTPNYVVPTTSADQVRIGDGSSTTASLVFSATPAIGIYKASSYAIGFRHPQWGDATKTVIMETGSLISTDSGGMGVRLRRSDAGVSNYNYIFSTQTDGSTLVPLKLESKWVWIPTGTESLPGMQWGNNNIGIMNVTTPSESIVVKTKYSSYYNYTEFGGNNGGDGGIRFRRGDTGSSYQNTVASYRYDGTTLTKLRLKGDKITFAVGATGAVELTFPQADGTNGQFLSTNGSGTLSWKGGAGISSTITVRNAAGDGTCTITFVNGVATATTC